MPLTKLEKNGPVNVLSLTSPGNLNALDTAMMCAIGQALDAVEQDTACRALILTGCEKAFIAGADISEMLPLHGEHIRTWSHLGCELNTRLEQFPVPVIAAVNGYALGGGCELAISCDLILASEDARFGFPEATLAVTCGAGGTQRLPRLIGAMRARELLMTGRVIKAQEAAAIGLINRVVPNDKLLEESLALAGTIAANGPLAVCEIRQDVRAAAELPLEEGLQREREGFCRCSDSADRDAGMGAFLQHQKHPPYMGH